ncbi:MAG: hypothetical protein HRK26_04200 [Rickettsiaceae bacterium H1]|nr:hypothetical protein [Rickettsiaceae bacterium H1]
MSMNKIVFDAKLNDKAIFSVDGDLYIFSDNGKNSVSLKKDMLSINGGKVSCSQSEINILQEGTMGNGNFEESINFTCFIM